MQGLPVDERLHAHLQLLGLPVPSPGKSCHNDYTECRLVPGRGPADHLASHRGEALHAGAHQVSHTQEERAPLEELGCPGMCRCPLGTPANLVHVLHLPCPWVPQATHAPCPAWHAPLPIGRSDGVPRALLGDK